MKRENHFYRIDFLRMIFVFIIIYGHILQHFLLKHYGNSAEYMELNKYFTTMFGLSCEMLFIISGFLFFYTLKKETSLLDFIITKWIRLAPVVIFSLIIYFVFSKIGWYKFSVNHAIIQSIFLPYTGIAPSAAFPYLWYIDAMFWGMVFYFYLIRNFNAKYINLFIALIIYFSYVIIIPSNNWYPQNPYCNGILFTYMLRALSGLGIGYFCACLYEKYSLSLSLSLSLLVKIIISIAETAIFLYVVKILVIRQTLASTLAYPILFISLFILFLMKRGYFSNFVDRKLFSILGRYGYTAYVMSYVTGIFLMNIVWNNKDIGISAYPMLHLALYIVFTYGIAVLVYHGIEKPIGNILKRTYKNSKKV